MPLPISIQVRNSFHSVDLCNSLVSKGEKDSEINDTVKRNKEHLQIMLNNEEFVAALTPQQRTDIDNCITTSEAFLAS
jgi:hypothetical protein